MEQYNSYKDSGVEWIGEVPSHWEVMKTSLAFHGIGSGTTPSTSKKEFYDENDGYYWLQTGDLNDGIINETSKKVTKFAISQCNLKFYPKDSIVIAMYGATIGKVGILGIKTATNQACCVLPTNKNMNAKFAFYEFLACKPALLVSAIGGGQPNISQDVIRKQKIVIPPLLEQTAIASYLDKKCSEIDNVISAQQKRIALLQELKQSVITHAVTKGLNPNMEMKDSGVEWIGKIPASWDVVHLKRILRERMQYGANEPAESDETTYPRYIRITDITANGELRPETFKSLEPSKAKDYLLDKGDVLFARSGATVGKTFLFNADIKACYAGYLIKASCDKRKMLPEYLYYYTQSGAYECWKNSVFIQATIQNIGADKYQMMYIPVPSKDEQKQIVEYTMSKSQIFDAAISKAQHQVELLQEYKQSLITEVVTGKRKVS